MHDFVRFKANNGNNSFSTNTYVLCEKHTSILHLSCQTKVCWSCSQRVCSPTSDHTFVKTLSLIYTRSFNSLDICLLDTLYTSSHSMLKWLITQFEPLPPCTFNTVIFIHGSTKEMNRNKIVLYVTQDKIPWHQMCPWGTEIHISTIFEQDQSKSIAAINQNVFAEGET